MSFRYIIGLPGIAVEVKRRERLNVAAAVEQAVSEAADKCWDLTCIPPRSACANRKALYLRSTTDVGRILFS